MKITDLEKRAGDFSLHIDGLTIQEGATESLPAFLEVVEEVLMGQEAKSVIISGRCSYVPTGG